MGLEEGIGDPYKAFEPILYVQPHLAGTSNLPWNLRRGLNKDSVQSE